MLKVYTIHKQNRCADQVKALKEAKVEFQEIEVEKLTLSDPKKSLQILGFQRAYKNVESFPVYEDDDGLHPSAYFDKLIPPKS